jgi:aminopeptidase-like protein
MHALAARLYPISRSLTGEGVRATLRVLGERIPLDVVEVPSGTPVLDWTVPREWNLREAWIAGPDGQRIVDVARNNLHVVGYSVPVRTKLPLGELQEHLHSLPQQPDLVPYRTSYWEERWGFCLPHRLRESLHEGEYEVCVDATLAEGSLTYGELFLPGRSEREMLVSCHVCHPSLANDNLSGIAVATFLAELLGSVERRWSYRFLFVPGTIGSIVWLERNREQAGRIRAGLVAANLGDPGGFHYKKTWQGDALIDRAVVRALRGLGEPLSVEEFVPYGYDERQYASPGFRLPVGSLTRTPYGRYPEYHTSADDLDFIRPQSLAGSLATYLAVVAELEAGRIYRSTSPDGEPQLGRRGLYRSLGGDDRGRERELALLWLLNLADGEHSLTDVAERSGLPPADVEQAAERLLRAGLLAED